jgi:hypothetical protein
MAGEWTTPSTIGGGAGSTRGGMVSEEANHMDRAAKLRCTEYTITAVSSVALPARMEHQVSMEQVDVLLTHTMPPPGRYAYASRLFQLEKASHLHPIERVDYFDIYPCRLFQVDDL